MMITMMLMMMMMMMMVMMMTALNVIEGHGSARVIMWGSPTPL